ncbi:MAG: VOC family protein [Chloracidobacterium sp.]|nr:VOC family protein [Chloracidobacterium sp.]
MAEQASEMAEWGGIPHGTFCWTEIAGNDAEKCKAFYTNVFGWKFQDSKAVDGFAYHEYSTGGDYPAGGLYEIIPEMCAPGQPVPPPHFMTYVGVDDVDENAKLAVELGATIINGPLDVPNVGRMCIIQDPTGAIFSTFKMAEGGHNG